MAAGLRTGLLAMATGECDPEKTTPEQFVVAAPTPGQERDEERTAEINAEFQRWRRSLNGKAHG